MLPVTSAKPLSICEIVEWTLKLPSGSWGYTSSYEKTRRVMLTAVMLGKGDEVSFGPEGLVGVRDRRTRYPCTRSRVRRVSFWVSS
jgi:hypothetical protein